MAKRELDSHNGQGITEIIQWAAKLGAKVALLENSDELIIAGEFRMEFERRLSEMPRNSIGDFHIFGDVAVTAYTQGYVSGLRS